MTGIGIGLILLLIVGSGFFSSSEIALFSLPSHQVDAMVEQGLRGAQAVKSLKEDPPPPTRDDSRGKQHCQYHDVLDLDDDRRLLLRRRHGSYSSLGITSIVLVFGESAPQSYAVENTELHARRVARGLKIIETPLWPLITVFHYLTGVVNGLTGGSPSIESTYVSRDEIRNMIQTGEREGVLDKEEHQRLQRALRFTDATAKEVMTPRLDIAAVSGDATVEEAIQKCISSGHADLPVYNRSLDSVIGVFDIRDLQNSNYDTYDDLGVEDVIAPTLHIPESKNVDDLLSEQRSMSPDSNVVPQRRHSTNKPVSGRPNIRVSRRIMRSDRQRRRSPGIPSSTGRHRRSRTRRGHAGGGSDRHIGGRRRVADSARV
ncbi:CNNM domain-containing protein [Halobacterium salinarum]